MAASTSDLPFGSEFSPSVIDLPELLEIIKQHEGNNTTLEDAIWQRWFTTHSAKEPDPKKRESVPRLISTLPSSLFTRVIESAGCMSFAQAR